MMTGSVHFQLVNLCLNDTIAVSFQSLCYMMFHQYASWHPALLFDPPKSIESELERVLDQCINPGKRLMHNPKDVMATLRRILQLSI